MNLLLKPGWWEERRTGGLLTKKPPDLLFLPGLESSKFVQNLRKLTPESDCGQNATSVNPKAQGFYTVTQFISVW